MITSVDEAIRDGVVGAFSDWIDALDRGVLWSHHISHGVFHEGSCDDDGQEPCDVYCPGNDVGCCCGHHVAPIVMVHVTLLPPSVGGKVPEPIYIALPMRMEMVASPYLEEVMERVREGYEERQVMGSLKDVDQRMQEILREHG